MLSIIKRIRHFSPVCYLHLLSVVVFDKYSFFQQNIHLNFQRLWKPRAKNKLTALSGRASYRRLVSVKIKVIAGCQQQKKDKEE